MAPAPSIVVPELRDYHQINSEIVRRLDLGANHVRLEGVEGQRLLASGLAGGWAAVIEVEGNAGPELAAGLNAPGVSVVCRGSAADGAGRALAAGTLVVLGRAGVALGYSQQGGLVIALGPAGPRAGLCQRGGDLVLLAPFGPLAGERQSGGRFFYRSDHTGEFLGLGSRGGRRIEVSSADADALGLDPDDRRTWLEARAAGARFASHP